MNRWIQRQRESLSDVKEVARPLLRGCCSPAPHPRVGSMQIWLTNCSTEETLFYIWPLCLSSSPSSFPHLDNLPLGLPLPSPLVLSVQLSGPASIFFSHLWSWMQFFHCPARISFSLQWLNDYYNFSFIQLFALQSPYFSAAPQWLSQWLRCYPTDILQFMLT